MDEDRQLLEAAVAACQDGMMVLRSVCDAKGRLLDFECILANDALRNLTGYQPKPGNRIGKDLPLIADAAFLDAARAVTAERVPREWERTIAHPGGDRVLHIRLSATQDGCIATLQDRTPLRRSEEELARSQSLLTTVFETLPHVVYVKDTQGRFVLVNRHFLEFYGVKPDELIGRPTVDIAQMDPLARRMFIEQDREVLAGRTPQLAAEVPFRLPSGEVRRVQVHKAPMRDAQGRVTGLVGISQDVTAERNVALALAASEERFRNLAEGSLQASPSTWTGSGAIATRHSPRCSGTAARTR
jgi:PAS domain S-box-containing protein